MTVPTESISVSVPLGRRPPDRAAVSREICEETVRVLVDRYPETVRSIVLTGSLARDEGTIVEGDGVWKLLGDAEFFVAFVEGAPLPERALIPALCAEIETGLRQRGVQGRVSLSAVHPAYFRNLEPHILAVELRSCGRVVWGDNGILSLMPAFSVADIPREDAWRLLANRIVEQLEAAGELLPRPEALPARVHYQTVKLYLDMATSLLVFAGGYEPTYQERAARLRSWAEKGLRAGNFPFSLERFSKRVAECTAFKLGAGSGGAPVPTGIEFWQEAVDDAHRLWNWELKQLLGVEHDVAGAGLMEEWMRRQPWGARLRGWAYVLRQRGWHRSWRQWPRWMWLAFRSSPRHAVYAAASELFFSLPAHLAGDRGAAAGRLRSSLPVAHQPEADGNGLDWMSVASDVGWNYHEFLECTRA